MGKLNDFKTSTVDFAERVGIDMKELRTRLSVLINDNATSSNSTWSSNKISLEIAEAVANAGHLTREVVQTLPNTGEENVIYLVPRSSGPSDNMHTEYMYIDGEWEIIGDTAADLSGYVRETDIPGLLGLEADASSGLGLSEENFTSSMKSKLDNLIFATKPEAEAGSSTSLYMSPKRVEDYVDNQVGDADPLLIYNTEAGN